MENTTMEQMEHIYNFVEKAPNKKLALDVASLVVGGSKTNSKTGRKQNKGGVNALIRKALDKGVALDISVERKDDKLVFTGEGCEAVKNEYGIDSFKVAHQCNTKKLWKNPDKYGFQYLPEDLQKEAKDGWSRQMYEIVAQNKELVAEVLKA